MNKEYDVIIIGGGVTGAAIARELSRFRVRAALLEKEEELAFGVSKSNSGIIHPGTQNPADSIKGKLCVEGNKLVRKLAKDLGIDFQEVGELIVAFNEHERRRLLELKDEAEQLAVPGLRIVGRNWLLENEPNLNKDALEALFAPTAGIISPYRLVYDLSENAARNGVDIFTGTRVLDIKKGFEISTTKGSFSSRYVVNAAGLYADNISNMVGVEDFKIHPRKGEEFLLDKKRHNLTRHLLFPLPGKTSKGILVTRTADGNPMIGPTAVEIEDKTDLATDDGSLAKVVANARKLVPTIDPNDIIAYFAGIRPAAGQDFIIRHEDSVPGFVNVAGIQSPGLTAAPAVALMVRNILKDNGLNLRRKLVFHPHRKRTVHLFEIPKDKTRQLIKKDPSYGDIICRCEMVSKKEVTDAIKRGAATMDGIKFRTRAQAGRCHGTFCTTRLMRILSEKTGKDILEVSKRGEGSEIVKKKRYDD